MVIFKSVIFPIFFFLWIFSLIRDGRRYEGEVNTPPSFSSCSLLLQLDAKGHRSPNNVAYKEVRLPGHKAEMGREGWKMGLGENPQHEDKVWWSLPYGVHGLNLCFWSSMAERQSLCQWPQTPGLPLLFLFNLERRIKPQTDPGGDGLWKGNSHVCYKRDHNL